MEMGFSLPMDCGEMIRFFFFDNSKKIKYQLLSTIVVKIFISRASALRITTLYFYFQRSSVDFVCNENLDDIAKKATLAIAYRRSKCFCSKTNN